MELDRPHRPAASTTSDLFICFTSRLSHSSSMRLSSTKSILSPGRTDKPPVSLPTSLSRRLRSNNGSLKGGQSPMFPPGVSKKRGCTFDNPEPSSPKVTCIGQVRVKTKKQGKKMKLAYKARRSGSGGGGGGDVSFRGIEGSANQESQQQDKNNQSWVHLPLTLCDALSCFVPCRSSCSSGKSNGNPQERENNNNSSSSSSCGGGVLRWLVAFNEGEGKTRDIELVVEEEEEEGNRGDEEMERVCSRRRSIFDDMDFSIDETGNGGDEGKEGAARVSICIPPKNALLLMRCRSDPVKMSALATKFMESPPVEEDVIEEETGEERRNSVREDEKIESFLSSAEDNEVRERLEEGEEEVQVGRCSIDSRDVERVRVSVSEDEVSSLAMLFEDPVEMEDEANCQFHDPPESAPSIEHQEEEEEDEDLVEIQVTVIGKDSIFDQIEEFSNQLPPLEGAEKEDDQDTPPAEEEEEEDEQTIPENQSRSEEQSTVSEEEEEEEKQLGKPVLPDCLLLMMCEPKLSMEVSKETWVCSTDFIRWLPEGHRQHQLKKIAGGDEPNKAKKKKSKTNRASVEPNPQFPPAPAGFQPPRSSCSFPISMASLIEKKLVSAVAYEPFVLTRCKSEPMRSATAKLGAAQEVACFWKNRKIEPHRPATCGIGAAGVGF